MEDISYAGKCLLESFPNTESTRYRQQLRDVKQYLAKS